MTSFDDCALCPRQCLIDRSRHVGVCLVSNTTKLSLAVLHFGEEPPLVGTGGSGALFFCGCPLKCPFCQNWQISRNTLGQEASTEALAEIFLKLQQAGAVNLNLVTGTPFIPAILDALDRAKLAGLKLPVLWNTSAYEEIDSLIALEKHVSLYLPDLKTLDTETAKALYAAPDYPQKAVAAIDFMVKNHPLRFENNLLKEGVIIRHLALPDRLDETRDVIKLFAKRYRGEALLSLLTQYTPVAIPGETRAIPMRHLDESEEAAIVDMLAEFDINDGYFQDLVPSSDWLPNFESKRPFASQPAKNIWPW